MKGKERVKSLGATVVMILIKYSQSHQGLIEYSHSRSTANNVSLNGITSRLVGTGIVVPLSKKSELLHLSRDYYKYSFFQILTANLQFSQISRLLD